MTRRTIFALLAAGALVACQREPRFEQTNAATDEALNAAAANISEGDGADLSVQGPAAKAAGERLRAAAAEPPH